MSTLIQDLKFGLRMLAKNPGFTAVAVLTLALGIGANTAIFSVIEAVLLRPLAYKDPGRLVLLADTQDPQYGGFLYKDFEGFKSQAGSFEDLAPYYRDTGFSQVTLSASREPELVQGGFVSANFFPLMGVPPLLGRTFTPEEEERQEHVVVLSHGLWLRRLGGSLDVLGKSLLINGLNSQIVGVMPASFQFPARDQQFWSPITTNPYWGDPALTTRIDPRHTRLFYERWQVIGRLKSDMTLLQAQSEIDTIFTRIEHADPDKNRGVGIKLVPLRVNFSGNTRRAFAVLFGAVFFVLLIACSNVVNLVLARGTAREREMAVRTALGAGRGRLLRQLLTESALLAVLSGGLGFLLAALGLRGLIALGPPDIPRLEEASLDSGVFAFTLTISLFSAIIFGLAPAWRTSRKDPHESLKSGSGGAVGSRAMRRTCGMLVASEFALAVVLLTGAGLMVRSLLAVEAVNPGFQPEHVLTMNVTLPGGTPVATNALHDQILTRVRALPKIQAVGAVSGLFEFSKVANLGLRVIEGRPLEPPKEWTPMIWSAVEGDFFQAMGTRLLLGRYFSERDNSGSPLVVVIDESMARRYWPGENPIGKRFKGQDPRKRNDEWLTVIGVVEDSRRSGLEKHPVPHVYEWYAQASADVRTSDFVVRTTGDPRAAAASLRAVVRGLSDTAIISPVTTLEQQLSEQVSPRRFQTWLLGLFSLMALVLSSVGIYGVLHYSVAQRTHEMGIRMALGAHPGDVLRMVVREGTMLALIGVAVGAVAARALTRWMANLLFGVTPTDPVTFIGATLLLTAVAAVASYIPARRATKVDPMVALRYE